MQFNKTLLIVEGVIIIIAMVLLVLRMLGDLLIRQLRQ